MIGRRTFLAGTGAVLLAAPLAVEAQQPDRVRRIGLLLPYIESDSQAHARVSAFRAALQELGWADGRNARFEFRYTEGQLDRLPALAADLVERKMDVILTAGTESTDAAWKATKNIPIVMAAVGDPIAAGFIGSLARPGGNVTGASLLATELTAKRLQLLKETRPRLTRVAVLWSAANASVVQKVKQIRAALRSSEFNSNRLSCWPPAILKKASSPPRSSAPKAVMTTEDALQITNRVRVAELGKRHRIPVASEFAEFARAGALMSYGPSILDQFRDTAGYVDKIFKGAKPSDPPVEQATRFKLVINLKTAKALGLTIPPSLLGRADEVIQ